MIFPKFNCRGVGIECPGLKKIEKLISGGEGGGRVGLFEILMNDKCTYYLYMYTLFTGHL